MSASWGLIRSHAAQWRATLLIAAIALTAPGAAAAADQIALVIGNENYEEAPDASGARDDAKHVASELSDAGYEVYDGYDLDAEDMRDLVIRFERALRVGAGAGGGLQGVAIYVSAHAVRADGRGYVAPVDLDAATLTGLTLDGAPLELLLDLAALATGRAVVSLDLSRQDGFTPSGIAEPGFADLDDPEGVLVISAAQPGLATPEREADEVGVFAQSISEEMLKPGAPANSAALALAARMRGAAPDWPETWIAGDTDADFAMAPASEDDLGELRARMELEAWRAAEDSGARRDYLQYLRFFPEGVFADVAEERIAEIDAAESGVADARRAEDALRLSVRERARVQARLTALGFDTGGVDGVFGPASRRALAGWQRDRGDTPTGYLTEEQFAALRSDADDRRRAADLDRRDWEQAEDENTAAAYEAYLREHPEGLRASEAKARLEDLDRDQDPSRSARDVEEALVLTRADRIAVQRALTDRGYDTRGVDGAFGPASRNAIAQWQGDRGDAGTGYLTEEQFAALAQASEEQQKASKKEENVWRRAAERDRVEDYRDYLERYPDGKYANDAERRILEKRSRSQNVKAAKEEERRQNFTETQRRSIEGRLAALGYDTGSQDGRFTKTTRKAIASFQRSRDLFDSGYMDQATVQELVRATPEVSQQELIGGAINELFRRLEN